MLDYKVVICGCTKNSGDYILNRLVKLSQLGKKFSQYKIIIYENDSSDNTVERFKTFKKHCSKFQYISENGIANKFSGIHSRVQIITHGRNTLLNIVEKQYGDYDLLIMIDLDDVMKDFDSQNLVEIFSKYNIEHWDGLTANCEGSYYDIWALRIPPHIWKDELHGKIWDKPLNHDCWNEIVDDIPVRTCIKNYQRPIPVHMPLIETESSFNGLGIYKISKIKGYRYDAFNRDKDNNIIFGQCEHVSFHRKLRQTGGRIFICPLIQMSCAMEHIRK